MLLEIRSPLYEQASLQIPDEVSTLSCSFNGIITSRMGDEYNISENIVNLLPDGISNISLAQTSNNLQLTAAAYEDIWRKRSLTLLTGDEFPLKKELEILTDWLPIHNEGRYLDLGCSSGLYARIIKKQNPESTVIALDFSMPMLRQARRKAVEDGRNIYLIRADARKMPFYAHTFDGIACGGTLNELTDPQKVLYEAHRILKSDGNFFIMHLLKSESWYKRILQQTTEWSGLTFWKLNEVNQLFKKTGFKVQNQSTFGMVCFTHLLPA